MGEKLRMKLTLEECLVRKKIFSRNSISREVRASKTPRDETI